MLLFLIINATLLTCRILGRLAIIRCDLLSHSPPAKKSCAVPGLGLGFDLLFRRDVLCGLKSYVRSHE
ncbi:hypothetical protein PanWU01x14_305020 [Parasponia andersonii]|uniref:Secreted protein n=1 Tax=Parasponia andersonii TaxID=3476 RepID=A0A2P5ASC0_PARAD|nr:hypothetical protein PanWU01x14_305020 [Parasponia andersonii]